MTFQRRVTDLIVDELVVPEGWPLCLVWRKVQKLPQEEVGLVLIEQLQREHTLKLNHEAGDPLRQNLLRTLQFFLKGLHGLSRREEAL